MNSEPFEPISARLLEKLYTKNELHSEADVESDFFSFHGIEHAEGQFADFSRPSTEAITKELLYGLLPVAAFTALLTFQAQLPTLLVICLLVFAAAVTTAHFLSRFKKGKNQGFIAGINGVLMGVSCLLACIVGLSLIPRIFQL